MNGVSGKFWQNGTIGLTSNLASIELPSTGWGIAAYLSALAAVGTLRASGGTTQESVGK